MEAIKKKMQSMKLENETAFEKADQLEQKLNEQKTIHDKVRADSYNCLIAEIIHYSRSNLTVIIHHSLSLSCLRGV